MDFNEKYSFNWPKLNLKAQNIKRINYQGNGRYIMIDDR